MLVVFDVDGTLTATGALDAEVFAEAFVAVFGVPLPTTDWTEYASPSDRGIAEEAVRRLRLDPGRIPELRRRVVADLRRALARRGATPVAGAAGVLGALATAGHATAFATGAWEASARAKLAAAGLEPGERVLVGSDFDARRERIVAEAVRRCGAEGRSVYVGDAPWDARAARVLRIPFVGVDSGRTGALHRAGVVHVVPGYEDVTAFLSTLEAAVAP